MSATALEDSSMYDGINARNFKRLAAYIYAETGIKMPESKLTMLEGRLRRRVRALRLPSLDAYCEHIFTATDLGEEATHLINAVTTNKTDFFREPKHFDHLRETLLPALAESGVRTVRCWSAACSTGAEPYTIAMLLADFAEHNGGPDYEILATDLDTAVLETAR